MAGMGDRRARLALHRVERGAGGARAGSPSRSLGSTRSSSASLPSASSTNRSRPTRTASATRTSPIRMGTRSRSPSRPTPRARHLGRPDPGLRHIWLRRCAGSFRRTRHAARGWGRRLPRCMQGEPGFCGTTVASREKQPRVLVLVGDALLPELLARCLGLRKSVDAHRPKYRWRLGELDVAVVNDLYMVAPRI
jgi:hypothetical protein